MSSEITQDDTKMTDTDAKITDTDTTDDTNVGVSYNNAQVFTWKRGSMVKGKKLGRISMMDNFIVSFNITVHGISSTSTWQSVLRVGNGDKERIPGMWLYPNSYKLAVTLSDVKDYRQIYGDNIDLEQHKLRTIKFQSINSTVKLFVDNELKASKNNVTHITKFRVPIWCGDFTYPAGNATISDLKITSWM
mmetsp:Transcript_44392/g.54374  ORF Transcript_44392/g.54374 Transcript_44392/m.54374 type:complete len:191 (-) Transcript_44392:100-672(-)